MLSAKKVAYEVTKALDEKKGMDIKLLKIDKVSSLADYFLICTGTSNTHVRTLCDYAEYTLEKIIYVADYMEPNRDFPGVEELRRLAYTDLDGALKLGLEMTLAMLREQKRQISPASSQALAYLEQKG